MRALALSALVVALAVSACSGESDSAAPSDSNASASVVADAWTEPQDVIDGLAEAGFDCTWSGTGDQIIDQSPISGQPAEVKVIRCDGYGVALGSGEEGWYSQILPECQPLTDNDRDSPLASAPIVLGTNFAVLGGAEAAQFPPDATAQDFIDAFGGEEITFLDLYDRVCGSE
jgi:hypothetical protein